MNAAARASYVRPSCPGLVPSPLGQCNCCIYCLYRIIFGCPTHFAQKKFTRSFVFNNLQSRKGKVPWDKSYRSRKYSHFFLPVGRFRTCYLLCLLDLYFFSCVSHAFCTNCATLCTVQTAQFLIRSSLIIHHSSFIVASCQRSSAYHSKPRPHTASLDILPYVARIVKILIYATSCELPLSA